MRALIGLLASTGVRSGEAFALNVSDLDVEAQVLMVTGKYGRKRLIALHPSAASALADYLRFREQHAADGTAALFTGQAGRRLGRSVAYPALPVADRSSAYPRVRSGGKGGLWRGLRNHLERYAKPLSSAPLTCDDAGERPGFA